MSEKLKYDKWIIWLIGDNCNLSCEYCGNTQWNKNNPVNTIHVEKIINSLNRTGKTFLISFLGSGEPFLVNNIIEACEELTKKHYISFFTNLTSNKIKEFSVKINPEKVTSIIASIHIKELERKNLTKNYIENFCVLKNKGFNIFAQAVAYPKLDKEIKNYMDLFKKQNIDLLFMPYCGLYEGKKYPESYTQDQLELYKFSKETLKTFSHKGELCNAGFNAIYVLSNGKIRKCPMDKNTKGNIYNSVRFNKKLMKCKKDLCYCPLKISDYKLYEKAIEETGELISVIGKIKKILFKKNE